jgi:hypothetical protein
MEIYNFKSINISPFSPYWNYLIIEDLYDLDLSSISKEILTQEKVINKKYEYIDDWGTGLGDSLTSRSPNYNILEWDVCRGLKQKIKETHENLIQELNLPKDKIYIQCWGNVMRKGQKINSHAHYRSPVSYLSGNFCVQTDNTSTSFQNPITDEIWSSENIPGKITLFPSWLKHFTDEHKSDDERITIAFDLLSEEGHTSTHSDYGNKWIEL